MQIKKVAVLGAGIMGSGIAQVVAGAGFDVSMRDIEDRFVEKGLTTIKTYLDRAVEKGKMKADSAAASLARIDGTTDMEEAVANAKLAEENAKLSHDTTRLVLYDTKSFFEANPELQPLRESLMTQIIERLER